MLDFGSMIFILCAGAVICLLVYSVEFYQKLLREEEDWAKAPCYAGEKVMRDPLHGDSIMVRFMPTQPLPRPGTKIIFQLKRFTSLDKFEREDFRTTVECCETCTTVGGPMDSPEGVVRRSPEVYIFVEDDVPFNLN